MSSLVLNMNKNGETPRKLSLSMKKNEVFRVKLLWEGQSDIDLHAILCVNTGNGAKASALEDILSTYNVKRNVGGQETGILPKKVDGSFEIHGGALTHSPDATDGDQLEIDEWIMFDPSKVQQVPGGVIEVPLIAMIHPQNSGKTFRDVANAVVVVEDVDGKEHLRASLSSQFSEFVGVQMGSIMMDANGTSFVAVGVGFNGDFNTVLDHFS